MTPHLLRWPRALVDGGLKPAATLARFGALHLDVTRPNRCQRTAFTRYFHEVARIIHAVRRAAKRIAITAAVAAGGAALERFFLAAPRYRGPRSDHFDGRRFHNLDRGPRQSERAFLKWQLTRQPGRWRDIDAPPAPPPPARVERGDLRFTFINHSTTLLQF